MTGNILHINYEPDGEWVRSLIRRLTQSSSSTLSTRVRAWGDGPLKELGYSVQTKLKLVSITASRVDRGLVSLSEQLEGIPNLAKYIELRAACPVPNKDLPFDILVDVEAFIFESRSTYEILGQFLQKFCLHILQRKVTEDELKDYLSVSIPDVRWIKELKDTRARFFHNAAPWIACKVSRLAPLEFELMILKRDVITPMGPADYVSVKQLRDIYEGFRLSLLALEHWINGQIEEIEAKEP